MGRKAKKIPFVSKKKPVLAKRFKCPFCANEDVVECKMNNRNGTGSLECRLCGASFQMPIHHLSEPIDVFSEWLDACEAAERGTNRLELNMKTGANNNEYSRKKHNGNFSHINEVKENDNLIKSKKIDRSMEGVNYKSEKLGQTELHLKNYSSLGIEDSSDDDSE